MKGLFQKADQLWKELSTWLTSHHRVPAGPSYLRFRVIDMAGDMEIAVGVPVADPRGDDRVVAWALPPGWYASLVYVGHGLPANKALLDWIGKNGLAMDRWDDPRGDAFACRCESVLTDRKTQPRKTLWEVEVSIKLKDPEVTRPTKIQEALPET